MPTSTTGDPLVCGALSVAGLIVGYMLRARVSDKASSRKEDWERQKTVIDQIHDLTDAAHEYYCLPPPDKQDRRKLGLRIQGIIRRLQLDIRGLPFERPANFDGYQRRLRQAATLGLVDDAAPLSEDDPTMDAIREAAASYVGAVELAYGRKYRSKDRSR